MRQGALSFERWTGVPAPLDAMRAAAGRCGAESSTRGRADDEGSLPRDRFRLPGWPGRAREPLESADASAGGEPARAGTPARAASPPEPPCRPSEPAAARAVRAGRRPVPSRSPRSRGAVPEPVAPSRSHRPALPDARTRPSQACPSPQPAREPPAALEPERQTARYRARANAFLLRCGPPSRRASAMDSENRPHLRPVGDGESIESEGALARQPDPERSDGITPPTRRGGSGRFLTDVIVELGFVERERRRDRDRGGAHRRARRPSRCCVEQGALTQDQLARAVAERYGLDHLDLTPSGRHGRGEPASAPPRPSATTPSRCRFVDERTLLVAMADPSNVLAVDDIAIMTGLEVRPAVASREDIQRRSSAASTASTTWSRRPSRRRTRRAPPRSSTCASPPTTRRSSSSCTRSSPRRSSRARRTSTSSPRAARCACASASTACSPSSATVPRRMVRGVVSRIKIMADLDISERRLPQDGRVGLTIEGRQIDIRVVTLPERPRRVGRDAHPRQGRRGHGAREARHAAERARRATRPASRQAYGAVLATGPTGSGKSTTLYAALQQINTTDKNIITIEDPVEYQLEGITQVQVNPKAGLTFATGLRSMMRADPDIIMVGEIRDAETAHDRRRGRADRPPRPLDAAHQRRADGDHPPARDGHRAVPRRLGDRLRRRPAPRAHAVRDVQEARRSSRPTRLAEARLQGPVRPRGLRARGLRALRRHRLQGPRRRSTR